MIMKKRSEIIIILLIITIFSFLIYFFVKNMYTFSNVNIEKTKTIYYKNSNPINLEEIVNKNTSIDKSEKLLIEEMDLEYKTLYKENNNLPSGFLRVLQLGETGKQYVILKQNYQNNNIVSEEIVSNNIIQNSIEKIIEVGTGKGYIKTKIKQGDKVFVCANNLKLKKEKNLDSETICILGENEEIKILDIYDNWYYINYNDIYVGTPKEIKTKEIIVSILCDDEKLFSAGYQSEDEEANEDYLNNFLDSVKIDLNQSNNSKIKLLDRSKIDKLYLQIEYVNSEGVNKIENLKLKVR